MSDEPEFKPNDLVWLSLDGIPVKRMVQAVILDRKQGVNYLVSMDDPGPEFNRSVHKLFEYYDHHIEGELFSTREMLVDALIGKYSKMKESH